MKSTRCNCRRACLGALAVACLCPRPASSQDQPAAPSAPPDLTNSVIIAAIGSTVGFFGGGFLGYSIDRARGVPSEDPGLNGFIYGALATSALLTPSLLYLSNRRGPWPGALLLSATGTALAALAFRDLDRGLLVGPIFQVGISVALLH